MGSLAVLTLLSTASFQPQRSRYVCTDCLNTSELFLTYLKLHRFLWFLKCHFVIKKVDSLHRGNQLYSLALLTYLRPALKSCISHEVVL